MDVPRNATNLIIVSRLVDASGDPITGVAYNDADLALSSLKYGDSAYQSISLVAGTLGTYIANSWVEIGDGDYQFCPANALVVEGRNTVIKSVYDGNVIYGQINAVGGTSPTLTVVPLTGVVEERVKGTNIKAFVGETSTVTVSCIDAEGNAVTLTGKTLSVVIEGRTRTDKTVIPNESITVSGSTFSFALPSAVTAAQATYKWSLRQASDNGVLMHGLLVVEYAAKADS